MLQIMLMIEYQLTTKGVGRAVTSEREIGLAASLSLGGTDKRHRVGVWRCGKLPSKIGILNRKKFSI